MIAAGAILAGLFMLGLGVAQLVGNDGAALAVWGFGLLGLGLAQFL